MKFIHIADIHMGMAPDKGKIWSNDRTEEIHNTFVKVTKICEADKIDLLIIAGDLFDSQPTEKQLKELDFRLKQMGGTKTVIVAGDHDYISKDNKWSEHPFEADVKILSSEQIDEAYFEDLKVSVTGISYGHKECKKNIIETMAPKREDTYNILLGHGGDDTHMPFSREVVSKLGFDYVALGHLHKPSHMLKNRMAYAGSLEPLCSTETGKHGYILGEVDEQRNTTISFVPISRRTYINMCVNVSPSDTNEDIVEILDEQIKKNGTQNIYNITIKGSLASNVAINMSAITRRYNVFALNNETKNEYNLSELYECNEGNLLGEFIKEMSKQNQIEEKEIRYKALRYGVDALLNIGEE
ncbi:MAG: metallophosphoesterase [Lachnospiraceae bacterium]|nr:metallophosphoesterase [Lachnospiraceae bacterium]